MQKKFKFTKIQNSRCLFYVFLCINRMLLVTFYRKLRVQQFIFIPILVLVWLCHGSP